jgi:hypothetical protein
MKYTIKLIGIIALAAAIALSFTVALASCGDGAGGGSGPRGPDDTSAGNVFSGADKDGNIYSLEIIPKARAAAGDDYVLRILLSGGITSSSETVVSVSGSTIRLSKDNVAFSVTVSGSGGITAMSGEITLDDNSKLNAPTGALTGGGGVSNSLIGTWVGAFVYPDSPDHPDHMALIFNSDGTAQIIDNGIGSGTYTTGGNILTLTVGDPGATSTMVLPMTYAISSRTLTLTYKDDQNKDVTGTFTKVR